MGQQHDEKKDIKMQENKGPYLEMREVEGDRWIFRFTDSEGHFVSSFPYPRKDCERLLTEFLKLGSGPAVSIDCYSYGDAENYEILLINSDE